MALRIDAQNVAERRNDERPHHVVRLIGPKVGGGAVRARPTAKTVVFDGSMSRSMVAW